jgi:class 3 adenylate cyclase
MSRIDCISCRNTKIVATYVGSKIGHHNTLFEGLPYPSGRYDSPEKFFLNEDEWISYDAFYRIFKKAREMVGEKYFYFNCGASSAILRSWGRLEYFARIFTTPCDGFKRLPFFNRNFNDTKDIEVIQPPAFDRVSRKIRTILKIEMHEDFDVHKDYIGDPYARGIIAAIPTIWGLSPALVRQPVLPYDPVVLFDEESEFACFKLGFRMDKDRLTAKNPADGRRMVIGKKVFLIPRIVNGKKYFLGEYTELPEGNGENSADRHEAMLIDETLQADGRIIVKAGEIYKGPYFILDVTYDRFSLCDRLSQIFNFKNRPNDTGTSMIDTITQLRQTIEARNEAYLRLEKANTALREAKQAVDDHAKNLEQKVAQRTLELTQAKEKLMDFNRNLKTKIEVQVKALKKYDELRRYLSPKLTEKILSSGGAVGAEPKRKIMTVFFSDIRSFSALTDSIEPEEIFHLLDDYLSEMTQLIHQYDGTLNKIIGDGLLVFFGDPVPMEDHAARAVKMAVEMQKRVKDISHQWRAVGHDLGIGIGINTGYMTVGNIGSHLHKDYTVIGNQVNIAARLESLAKPGEILVSHRTYSQVKEAIFAEKKGVISVKGIHYPIAIYNVKSVKMPNPSSLT